MTDPLDTARTTLAQIHAETVQQESILRQMHTEGLDHFQPGMLKAAAELTDGDLDNYTREAGALAAMQEGRRI